MKVTRGWMWGVMGGVVCQLVLTGCAGRNDVGVEEETDLTAATDLFDPAAAGDDPVLIRVDGVDITQGQFANELNMMMGQMQGQLPPEQMAQMQEEIAEGVMENLIIKQLLLNQVEKEAVMVADDEIEELIDMYRQQMPPDTSLEAQLAQMNMSPDEFRDNLRREMRVNKMLEAKVADVAGPTEEMIAAFHADHLDDYFTAPESVRASHILITVDADAAEADRTAAQEKAESLRAQLLDGADFAELAGAHSDCPSGQRGGDLGTFGRGQMVPPFEAAAFAQEVGAIGDVVETDFGFHVIKVAEKIAAGTQSLEETRDQIAQFLEAQSREEALRSYVEQLRDGADIEYVGTP